MWVRTSQGVCQRLGKPQASQLWARSKIIAASKTVASYCGLQAGCRLRHRAATFVVRCRMGGATRSSCGSCWADTPTVNWKEVLWADAGTWSLWKYATRSPGSEDSSTVLGRTTTLLASGKPCKIWWCLLPRPSASMYHHLEPLSNTGPRSMSSEVMPPRASRLSGVMFMTYILLDTSNSNCSGISRAASPGMDRGMPFR
mmetsp:Transcript_1286/g.2985  ORF Transcript_1286/g.2985 Transcript_1286/m.2985 type:complete len:200 (-) Transcript_1286:44-643(-)